MSRSAWNENGSVVFVGQLSRRELAACVEWWQQRTQPTCFASLHDLWQSRDKLDSMQLLVLAQSRLGEFPAPLLRQVLRRYPLARVITVYGSWCESESRTGSPPVSVLRIPWTHAVARFVTEFERVTEGTCPSWSWPWTASDEERDFFGGSTPDVPSTVRCGIATASRDMSEALMQLIRSWPAQPVCLPAGEPVREPSPDVILWDDCAAVRGPRFDLDQLAAWYSDTPLVALVDFPREFDQERFSGFQRAALLAKPFRSADLMHAVLNSVENRASRRETVRA